MGLKGPAGCWGSSVADLVRVETVDEDRGTKTGRHQYRGGCGRGGEDEVMLCFGVLDLGCGCFGIIYWIGGDWKTVGVGSDRHDGFANYFSSIWPGFRTLSHVSLP
jgi:hypothetical protein